MNFITETNKDTKQCAFSRPRGNYFAGKIWFYEENLVNYENNAFLKEIRVKTD